MVLKVVVIILSVIILAVISHLNFTSFENIRYFNLITESFMAIVASYFFIKTDLVRQKSYYWIVTIGFYLFFIALVVDSLDQLYYHPPLYTAIMEKSLKVIGYGIVFFGVKLWFDEFSQLNLKLKKLASEDNLTSLFNRRGVQNELDKFHKRSKKENQTYSLIIIDLDDFKLVNDTFGHLIGDEILKRIGHFFRSLANANQKVGRWGGEEFAMIIYGKDDIEAAEICNELRLQVEAMDMSDILGDHKVTMSFGVSELKGDKNYLETLKRADKALYVSKKSGKNCVTIL